MGVLLRIVVGLGTTCNDTQMGNALRLQSARLRRANRISGLTTNDGGSAVAKVDHQPLIAESSLKCFGCGSAALCFTG